MNIILAISIIKKIITNKIINFNKIKNLIKNKDEFINCLKNSNIVEFNSDYTKIKKKDMNEDNSNL